MDGSIDPPADVRPNSPPIERPTPPKWPRHVKRGHFWQAVRMMWIGDETLHRCQGSRADTSAARV